MSFRHSYSKGRKWKEKGVISSKQFKKFNRENSILFQGLGKNSLWLKAPLSGPKVLFSLALPSGQSFLFYEDIENTCFQLSSFISLLPTCWILGVNSLLSCPSISDPFCPSFSVSADITLLELCGSSVCVMVDSISQKSLQWSFLNNSISIFYLC